MRFSLSFILSVLLHTVLLLAVIFWPQSLTPAVDLRINPESAPLVGWLTLDNPGGKTGSKPGAPRLPVKGQKTERPQQPAKPVSEPAGSPSVPAAIPAPRQPEPEVSKTPEPKPAPLPEPSPVPTSPSRPEPAPEPKKESPAKVETVPENVTPISPNKAEEATAPEPVKKEEPAPKKDKPADESSKKPNAGETSKKDTKDKAADAGKKTEGTDKTKPDGKKNNNAKGSEGKADPLKAALAEAHRDVARREKAKGNSAVNDALKSMQTDAVVMDALRDLGEGEGGGEGNGMGGGVGDGTGVQVTYQTLVSGIIRNYWTYPNQGDRSIPIAVAYVQISTAGEVVDYRIVKSSGRPDFDSSILAAIRKANHHPLPPPPSGKIEEFTIRFYNAERR